MDLNVKLLSFEEIIDRILKRDSVKYGRDHEIISLNLLTKWGSFGCDPKDAMIEIRKGITLFHNNDRLYIDIRKYRKGNITIDGVMLNEVEYKWFLNDLPNFENGNISQIRRFGKSPWFWNSNGAYSEYLGYTHNDDGEIEVTQYNKRILDFRQVRIFLDNSDIMTMRKYPNFASIVQAMRTTENRKRIAKEIAEKFKNTKKFLGVMSRDMMGEDPKIKPCGLIFNEDSYYNPGTKWLAIYIDQNGDGEYFDPFGLPPNYPSIINYLKKNTRNYKHNEWKFLIEGGYKYSAEYSSIFLYLRFKKKDIYQILSCDLMRNDEYIKKFYNKIVFY